MAITPTTNVQFQTLDYTGTNVLSTYTLDITPISFIPNFTTSGILTAGGIISNNTIHWNFGDGTYADTLTASHAYKWPGVYSVTLTVYDNNGAAYDSSFYCSITAYDFVPTLIEFAPVSAAFITNNKIVGPLTVNVYNSWQSFPALSSTGYTINFYASGAAANYENADYFYKDKWAHLRPINQFLAQESVFGVNQYVAVNALTASSNIIYANIINNTINICGPGSQGATIVGVSGNCQVYYYDDLSPLYPSLSTNIFATIDNSKFQDSFTFRTNLFNYVDYPVAGFQNITPAVFVLNKTNYNPASAIAISTTGITGEGIYASSLFNIPNITWQGTEVPYMITLKDTNYYTTKFYNPLYSSSANTNAIGLTSFNISTGIIQLSANGSKLVNVPLNGVTFVEDFDPKAPQSLGSFYKGYFTSTSTALSCTLTASMVVVDPRTSYTYTITGASNTFNIYSSGGQYNITKVNENWNASAYYKSLRFQEPLLDYDNFFTNFLGTIVGDINAYPYELGKTVYERIANFTSNRADIETANVDALLSLCEELSIQFALYNYDYPPQLRRMVDILSIKQSKLWGSQNVYNVNFNNGVQAYTDRSFGPNLGTAISPISGIITNCLPVVAYEQFSGIYTLVNTNSINGLSGYGLSAMTIPLSSYSNSWGWGLVVPPSVSGIAVSNYYNFFTYNNTTSANSYYDNIINWTDSLNTLTPYQSSYSGWSNDNGIVQNIISYELTKGLGLFTSAIQIALT
jgi:PKD domain